MERAPGVPVIVTVKSEENQIASWARRGRNRSDTLLWIERASEETLKAVLRYPDRILIVDMTKFPDNVDTVMTRVYHFVGAIEKWDPSYKSLEKFTRKGKHFGWQQRQPGDMLSSLSNSIEQFDAGRFGLSSCNGNNGDLLC
jgi:hypothetical protein